MTVDQGMRTEVYRALREAHGEKVANALMDMLPPAGVPELATKADLAALESKLLTEVAVLSSEFGEKLERGLREQGNRFIGWMMGTAGLIAAVVGVAAGLA